MGDNGKQSGLRPAVMPKHEGLSVREGGAHGRRADDQLEGPVIGRWQRFKPVAAGLDVSGHEESVLGWFEEPDGSAAEGIPSYVPMPDELLRAVKYWHAQVLHIMWYLFVTGEWGSGRSWRTRRFAIACIDKAAEELGEEAVRKATEEVDSEFRSKVNDERAWENFTNGTEKQWQAFQDEMHRGLLEQDAAAKSREERGDPSGPRSKGPSHC